MQLATLVDQAPSDREHRLSTLIDVLEYRPRPGGSGSNSDYRWDIEGWYGGDYNRLWFKSEGQQDTASKAGYDVDFQLLYGLFVGKYYDVQVGDRMENPVISWRQCHSVGWGYRASRPRAI